MQRMHVEALLTFERPRNIRDVLALITATAEYVYGDCTVTFIDGAELNSHERTDKCRTHKSRSTGT